MPPQSTQVIGESPPNPTKVTIALVGHHAMLMKLASMADRLSGDVADNQVGILQTYAEADMNIGSLWSAHISMQTQLNDLRTDLRTLIDAFQAKWESPTKKKRRAGMKNNSTLLLTAPTSRALARRTVTGSEASSSGASSAPLSDSPTEPTSTD